MAGRFRIATRVPPGAALKRIALSELEATDAALTVSVHEARKHCKKLRALLRLQRQSLGHAYPALNTAVRDAARALAGRRRLDALTRSCLQLRSDRRCRSKSQLALLVLVEHHLRSRAGQYAGGEKRAKKLLRQVERTIRQWQAPPLSLAALRKSLTESYRISRKKMSEAETAALPGRLHEWRKQAKFHYYQCQLLTPLCPQLGRTRARRLDRLCTALGDHHDLHELERLLGDPGGPFAADPACDTLRAIIRQRQQKLTADAFKLGHLLFDDKPRQWHGLLTQPKARALS